jgi:hypothetical protein
MYSQLDKAVVALAMGVVQVANVFGFHWGIDEHTVTTIVASATPALVWLWPNAPKDS